MPGIRISDEHNIEFLFFRSVNAGMSTGCKNSLALSSHRNCLDGRPSICVIVDNESPNHEAFAAVLRKRAVPCWYGLLIDHPSARSGRTIGS
jgi:hypothetical protein